MRRQGFPARRVRLALLVLPGQLARKALLGLRVRMVPMAHKARSALLALRVRKVRLVRKAPLVLPVPQGRLARKARLAPRGLLE